MLVLSLRTDNPQAEIGLFDEREKLEYETWMAHRQLAETIHTKLRDLLKSQDKDWSIVKGIVCFKGPGSFTGLRIGLSVANALASSLGVPIVAEKGDNWIQTGLVRLQNGENDVFAWPDYGSEPHVTLPKT